MRPFIRPEQPLFLHANWERWGQAFKERREKDGGAAFQWPTWEKQRIHLLLSEILSDATQGHCAYCDFHPLGSKEDSIDHFRPKSLPAFHLLVCKWENLYFSCPNCQGFKREQWSEATTLIAPDEEGYSFHRFFVLNYGTWEIDPNPRANPVDQARAIYTIQTLGLRDAKHVKGRRSNWDLHRLKSQNGEAIVLDDFAYRYLFE